MSRKRKLLLGTIIVILVIVGGTNIRDYNRQKEAELNQIRQESERFKMESEQLQQDKDKLETELEKTKTDNEKLRKDLQAKKKTTVRVASVKGTEQWRPLCEKYFGANANECLMVMKGESGGNPRAWSHTSDGGLMQINCPTWCKFFGTTKEGLFDPENNLKWAKVIYDRAGGSWRPWVYAQKIGL